MSKIYILGSGAMAKAMAHGLKNSGFSVVLVSREKIDFSASPELLGGVENELYGENFDIEGKDIILAFKPYALDEVAKKLSGKAKRVLSVLASTDLEAVKSAVKSADYAICMPNLAAAKNASITPFLGDESLSEIISGFGKAVKMASKSEFDAAGIISGCAPAFLALVAEALVNGAIRGGVRAKDANELVSGLFDSVRVLLASSHPALLKESICSPAGTTIEGISKLEEKGVRSAFIEAVAASLNKQKG